MTFCQWRTSMRDSSRMLFSSLPAVFLTVFSSGQGLAAQSFEPSSQEKLENLYEQLVRLSPDPGRVATVESLVLKRDAGVFTFHEGTFYLCTPINNRVRAAVFVGRGAFSLTPPTEIERQQLYRFFEVETLREEFTFLFLLFADSTVHELEAKLQFRRGAIPDQLGGHIDFCKKFLVIEKRREFDAAFTRTYLEEWTNDLFYAHFSTEKTRPLFFTINPYAEEEVWFERRADETVYFLRERVCQFHLQHEYAQGTNHSEDEKNFLTVNHTVIEASLNDDLELSASATLYCMTPELRQRALVFTLISDLVVDSVIQGNGTSVDFTRGEDGTVLWLTFDPPLAPAQLCTLRIVYHGEILERGPFSGRVWIRTAHFWYPRHDVNAKSTYDLTFHYPRKYDLIGTGREVSMEEHQEVKTSRWITDGGVHHASFNIGEYERHTEDVPGVASLTYYKMESSQRRGKEWDISLVSADVANAIGFYESVFGKCPVRHFYAMEIPFTHSEAFQGILQLSWATSQQSAVGFELHRAHEVAHQWWGLGVETKTYHDQWLAEAFATYSSLWYVQSILGDNERFFLTLDRWKELILNNRKFVFGSGQEAGPVWLGYRTEGEETEGDLGLIIYLKGAYVLHMLRVMLLDFRTMDESRFARMMAEFYSTFSGKEASTDDFRKVVEKFTGEPMDWFFRQWVYGTAIPSYKFSYRIMPSSEGGSMITCRVVQENVHEDFKMYIPLLVRFSDNHEMRFRFMIMEKITEFDLPPLSGEITEVVFNDLEGVLCNVELVDWE